MTVAEVWAIFAASLLHSVLPGPAMIVTATRTAQSGWRQGGLSVAGILCSRVLFASVAMAVLAGALSLSVSALEVLKWLGAAMLLLIAARLCQARPMFRSRQVDEATSLQSFMEALVLGLANPMNLVFCVALLPQVLPDQGLTNAGAALAILALVLGTAFAQAAAVLIGLGAMGSAVANGMLLQRLVGVALAGFAMSGFATPISEATFLSLIDFSAKEIRP